MQSVKLIDPSKLANIRPTELARYLVIKKQSRKLEATSNMNETDIADC